MQKYEIKGKNIHRGCKDHGPYFYGLFYFENTMKKCNILKKDFSDNTGYNNTQEIETPLHQFKIITENKLYKDTTINYIRNHHTSNNLKQTNHVKN